MLFRRPKRLLRHSNVPLLRTHDNRPKRNRLRTIRGSLHPLTTLNVMLFRRIRVNPLTKEKILFRGRHPIHQTKEFYNSRTTRNMNLTTHITKNGNRHTNLTPYNTRNFRLSNNHIGTLNVQPSRSLYTRTSRGFLTIHRNVFRRSLPTHDHNNRIILTILNMTRNNTLTRRRTIRIMRPITTTRNPRNTPKYPNLRYKMSPTKGILRLNGFYLNTNVTFIRTTGNHLSTLPHQSTMWAQRYRLDASAS